jgi:hypothetical protein
MVWFNKVHECTTWNVFYEDENKRYILSDEHTLGSHPKLNTNYI